MNSVLLDRLLQQLIYIRYCPGGLERTPWLEFSGYLAALRDLDLITFGQSQALYLIATSAYLELSMRRPMPSAAVKLQAVPANEPLQLQPVAAPRKLLLLCLLGRSPGSKITRTFAQPVGVSRLPAPWLAPSARWGLRLSRRSAKRSAVSGIWPIQNSPGLVLREAHAVAPSAEVLARLQRHGQANALRPVTRAV